MELPTAPSLNSEPVYRDMYPEWNQSINNNNNNNSKPSSPSYPALNSLVTSNNNKSFCFYSISDCCVHCKKEVIQDKDDLVILSCGHILHLTCISNYCEEAVSYHTNSCPRDSNIDLNSIILEEGTEWVCEEEDEEGDNSKGSTDSNEEPPHNETLSTMQKVQLLKGTKYYSIRTKVGILPQYFLVDKTLNINNVLNVKNVTLRQVYYLFGIRTIEHLKLIGLTKSHIQANPSLFKKSELAAFYSFTFSTLKNEFGYVISDFFNYSKKDFWFFNIEIKHLISIGLNKYHIKEFKKLTFNDWIELGLSEKVCKLLVLEMDDLLRIKHSSINLIIQHISKDFITVNSSFKK